METQSHWAGVAARIFRMGPPQVPGPEVAALMLGLCNGCFGLTVLLGVTPALSGLGDPLLAFDASEDMIAAVWPGDDSRRRAARADWRALPVADGTAAQVLGDGALNSQPDRAALRAVLGEVRRVLAPDGTAAFRVFTRPQGDESVEEVLTAARAGQIETLNVLRWRLASALARGPCHTVGVAEIVAASDALGDLAAFAATQGMRPDEAEHFSAYRGSATRYVFPDRAVFQGDAAEAGLSCTWVATEGYPGARDCPIAVLRRHP